VSWAALADNQAYAFVVVLLTIGLYGMVSKRDLLRKLIGLNIFQAAIYLFLIHGAAKVGASVPLIDPALGSDPDLYVNPLPHVLVLTAIVVGVALTGVALAMLVAVRREHGSLDEDRIRERLG